MFIIKITFNNVTRRIAIENLKNFFELQKFCKNIFNLDENVDFTYIDNENDIISLGSDLELEEAIRQLGKEKNTLKIVMKCRNGNDYEIENDSVTSHDSNIISEPVENNDSSIDNVEIQEKESLEKFEIENQEQKLALIESIEQEIKNNVNYISKVENSTKAESKFRQFIEYLKTKLKELSNIINEKVLNPISKFGKVKFAEFKEVLRNLEIEIQKIKTKIEVKIQQRIASKKEKTSSAKQPHFQPRTESEIVLGHLKNLEDMGFTDRCVNLDLLSKHSNNFEAVVNELLES